MGSLLYILFLTAVHCIFIKILNGYTLYLPPIFLLLHLIFLPCKYVCEIGSRSFLLPAKMTEITSNFLLWEIQGSFNFLINHDQYTMVKFKWESCGDTDILPCWWVYSNGASTSHMDLMWIAQFYLVSHGNRMVKITASETLQKVCQC